MQQSYQLSKLETFLKTAGIFEKGNANKFNNNDKR